MKKKGLRLRLGLRLALASIALATIPIALAGPDPAAPYLELAPAPGVTLAAPATLVLGHLKLRFARGAAFPLVTPQGEVFGLVFDGEGHYVYTSEDADDLVVLRGNARRVTGDALGVGPSIDDAFRRLVVLTTDPATVARLVPTGNGGVAPSGDAKKYLEDVRAQAAARGVPLAHRAAQARLDGHGRYDYAEIEGHLERVAWEYDALRDWRESLFALIRPPRVWLRDRRPLSEQPVEGGAPAHAALVRLVDGDFRIATEDNRSGTIDTDLVFETAAPARVLALALVNTRDDSARRWDEPRRALHVKRVVDAASGRELAFSHRYHELLVDLGAARAPGQLKLHFETAGDIFTEPAGRTGNNYFALWAVAWYPQPPLWNASLFTFHLDLRTAKPFRPVAPGVTVALRETARGYELEKRSEQPVWSLVVFAGAYLEQAGAAEGVTIRAHAYALAREDELRNLVARAQILVSFFTRLLGPLPVHEVDIVEVPTFEQFGVSPPGMAILTTFTFRPRDERRGSAKRGVALLAHELAHQWFGHVVWPADVRADQWVVESTAEYLAGVAVGAIAEATNMKGSALMLDFEQMHSLWSGFASWCEDVGSVRAASRVSGDLGPSYRYCLLYERGPLLVHMLRGMAGDARFLEILKRMLLVPGAWATADVERVTTDVLGQDMGWFFADWVAKPGTPRITARAHVAEVGGKPVLEGTFEQDPATFKRVRVPIELDAGAQRTVLRVFQGAPSQEFRVPLEAAPSSVRVDPDHEVLAVYK